MELGYVRPEGVLSLSGSKAGFPELGDSKRSLAIVISKHSRAPKQRLLGDVPLAVEGFALRSGPVLPNEEEVLDVENVGETGEGESSDGTESGMPTGEEAAG